MRLQRVGDLSVAYFCWTGCFQPFRVSRAQDTPLRAYGRDETGSGQSQLPSSQCAGQILCMCV